jgi:hypothetical protein
MSSSSSRKRTPRSKDSKPPGSLPSDIANAILDLSNRAEWTKLAIGKLKPTSQTDAPSTSEGDGDPSDREPEDDDRPSP